MSADKTPEPLVRMVPHNSDWAKACVAETESIRFAIAPARVFIDHVGSTAITGLSSKPIIDLLVTLPNWDEAGQVVRKLEAIGYVEGLAEGGGERHFLSKTGSDEARTAFHLHIAPQGSEWGTNMLVFRDVLGEDRELATRYSALKKELAEAHPNDPEAYTAGKSAFVGEVLRRAAASFGTDRLLTHQRAELGRAMTYQYLALSAQFGVAVVAAISVATDDNATQLNFALLGFVLAGLWLFLARRQRAHRSAGDQARRVVLLTSGLDERFSAEQRLRLFDCFTVATRKKLLVREESYFASRSMPGYQRLAELIEESAYWTRDLQQSSAAALQWSLLVIATLIAGALWGGLLSLPTDLTVSLARVLVALLVFLLSSDVVGALLAHREAAATISEIFQRVETAAARGYPSADVLLLMSNYNAAVEGAPFILPGVFSLRRAKLTKKWRNYLEEKRR